MHPIRILILAVLFYILYRILFGGKTKEAAKQAPPEIPTQDTLAEDPVCHTYVPQSQSLSLEKDGTTHYFCSQECLDTFKEQQQRRSS
ncbi:MAG: TRASH domain protein [Desulfobulbaceae bacterium]|nr:MAG: TRASH domain protein [Desulfobulbaceae bacterium]